MPIRNAPSPLPTTLRFMAARLAHRFKNGGSVSGDNFHERVAAVVRELGDAVQARTFSLRSASGWVDSGIELPANASFSLLAEGMVHVSRLFDVGFGPKVGLWLRVGDGQVEKIVGNGSTFSADRGGRLQFATKPPGEFENPQGGFDPGQKRDPLSGSFEMVVLQWRKPAAAALEAAAKVDAELFGPVLRRLSDPVRPPPGWHYLWRLGDGEIFHETCRDGHRALNCRTASDVGILQFPVDLPLAADTTLSWKWCVDALPSRLPEHIQPTHDYLSIAVEFDNGLDLTWMWSASLPEDTIFQCPLPWWDQRETHWVVRSGPAMLGRWIDEKRELLADYRKAIGGPDPQRIVGVWLIANSAFQRGTGSCSYRAISLQGGGTSTAVFD